MTLIILIILPIQAGYLSNPNNLYGYLSLYKRNEYLYTKFWSINIYPKAPESIRDKI